MGIISGYEREREREGEREREQLQHGGRSARVC